MIDSLAGELRRSVMPGARDLLHSRFGAAEREMPFMRALFDGKAIVVDHPRRREF